MPAQLSHTEANPQTLLTHRELFQHLLQAVCFQWCKDKSKTKSGLFHSLQGKWVGVGSLHAAQEVEKTSGRHMMRHVLLTQDTRRSGTGKLKKVQVCFLSLRRKPRIWMKQVGAEHKISPMPKDVISLSHLSADMAQLFSDSVNGVRCFVKPGLWSTLSSPWSHQRKAVGSSRRQLLALRPTCESQSHPQAGAKVGTAGTSPDCRLL